MFIHNINPVLFDLGVFQIRYYGLFAVISFILAYFILKHISKQRMIKLTTDKIENLLVYAGISGIIGARLFYVLIYYPQFYIDNPFEIIAFWHGGLSFHGALIGALLGIYLFCNKYKLNFLEILDISSIPFVLGLAIGRIANFINGELYGRFTNVPWCVDFGDGCRHPSQLYESLYSFFIFGVLWILKNKKLKKGLIFTTFILLYAFLRFFTEFLRAPDPQIGFILGLTIGQWLNTAMFIIGLFLLYKIRGAK